MQTFLHRCKKIRTGAKNSAPVQKFPTRSKTSASNMKLSFGHMHRCRCVHRHRCRCKNFLTTTFFSYRKTSSVTSLLTSLFIFTYYNQEILPLNMFSLFVLTLSNILSHRINPQKELFGGQVFPMQMNFSNKPFPSLHSHSFR